MSQRNKKQWQRTVYWRVSIPLSSSSIDSNTYFKNYLIPLYSCENIQDLNLCPKIYCADNPHFLCKRVGYQCKCPSCDAASERAWCVRTKCLEQPQKLKCVFDSETYKCRCPMCMDQNGDRPWCLMTYCGMNNHVKCR